MLIASTLAAISLIITAPEPARTSSTAVVAVSMGGQPGFFVPRLVFVELELAEARAPLLESALAAREAEARARADEAASLRRALSITSSAAADAALALDAQAAARLVAEEAGDQAGARAERNGTIALVLLGVAVVEAIVIGVAVAAH